ncbi:hypothetical protein ACMBCN_01430 [Candidatus Liberibacter asiaticus]|nr:hypothetical protein [Spiroplasma sp. Tabriz.8]
MLFSQLFFNGRVIILLKVTLFVSYLFIYYYYYYYYYYNLVLLLIEEG